jgi:hypothetical protein
VARFLFARRLQKAPFEHRPRVRFESRDLILGDPARFRTFLDELGGAAVLFSNFLGQLRVLLRVSGPDPRLDEAKRAIAQALAGRSWASFHDRVSGALSPDGREPLDAPRRLTDDEVTEGVFGGQELASQAGPLIGPGGDRPLLDHLTHGIFPCEQPYRYFVWELEPGQFHLIEATWHRESPAD